MSWLISVNTIIPKVSKSRSVRTVIRSCITRKRANPVRRRDAFVRVHASKQRLLRVDDVGLGAASGAVHRWTPVGREGRLVGECDVVLRCRRPDSGSAGLGSLGLLLFRPWPRPANRQSVSWCFYTKHLLLEQSPIQVVYYK